MSALGQKRTKRQLAAMSASLIGRLGQALSGYPPLQCRCRSRARASLRTRHQGPSIMGIRRRGGTIFWAALPSVRRQVQADKRSHLIHRPARDIIPPLGGSQVLLLSGLILHSSQATATSLVHRNAVLSTQMRCMITASRRASATIAFFIPRCLAIFIAQALSQDHFVERTSMLWAASYSIIRIISSPHRDIAPVRSFSPD